VSILCYHAVDPTWSSPLAVTPGEFAGHAAWLLRHRTVVGLTEAVRSMDRSYRLPQGMVALTFDDGFASVHQHALPVLRQLNVPATVFVVAQTLAPGGKRVDWVDDPPPGGLSTLTLDQLREMQDAGMRVGSHSNGHRVLTELTEEECESDLRASRELLQDLLGCRVDDLAYPRGSHDERVRRAAARAGFAHAFSLPEAGEPAGPLALPRVGAYAGNGPLVLRVKTSRRYLGFRTGRAYALVRRALAGRRGPSGIPG